MSALTRLNKPKNKFINEIINIIKKYNITIEDIIEEYSYKYEYQFSLEEQVKYKNQYKLLNNHLTINNKINKNDEDHIWFNKFTIIEDYINIQKNKI